MRRDYSKFQSREAEILVIAPDTLGNAQVYFERNQLPFPGLADEMHVAYDLYDVQSRALSLGQRPGLFIVDKTGMVRYAYLGTQQWQIPANKEVLLQLDKLQVKGN